MSTSEPTAATTDERGSTVVDLPGDGIPIVFIHGLGGASTDEYAHVVVTPRLAKRRRVLIDLVGSGRNAQFRPTGFDYSITGHARHISQIFDRIGLPLVMLYGHSMGGAIALSLTGLNPDRVAGVMVAEGNLDAGGGFASRAITAQSEDDWVRHGHAAMVQSEGAANNPWAKTLAESDPHAVYRDAQSLIAGVTPTWRQILYAFPRPKAYLFGERNLPDPDADVLSQHGVEVMSVPRAGHNMAWENPVGLATIIADFADHIDGGAH